MNVDRVVALLRDLEGFRAYVYDDRSPWPRTEVGRLDCREVAGQYKVNATGGTATIGYGETSADFIDRYWGRRITQAEALAKMAERVAGFHQGVLGCIDADLTEHQWEAITCRAYQTGAGGFCRSDTARLLNEGDLAGALEQWREEFAHPDRSEVEIAHFRTPDDTAGGATPMKLVTRAEWGARNTGLTPLDVDMVSVHWEGPHMGTPSHDRCAGIVLGFQNYHMDSNGWSDIAYNAVVCPHGYVFEGRGRGMRSAANGDSASNSASYAVCFMGGEGDAFTDEAKDAINDAAEWLVPDAGRRWGVHRDWVSTACPGDEITEWVRSGHPRASGETTTSPQPQGDLAMLTFRYIFNGQDWVFDGPSKLFFQLNDERQITEVLDPLGVAKLGQVSDVTHRRYSEIAAAAGFSG